MQITVKLIYKKDNTILNDNFVVLIDESLSDTKERLFFYNKSFYPNFVKFEDENNGETVQIDTSKRFLFNYDIPNKVLYVTLLTDVIENILSTFKLTCDMFYSLYQNDDETVDNILTYLISNGYSLSKTDLLGAVLIVLNNKFSSKKTEYNNIISTIDKCHSFVKKHYSEREEAFKKFYNECLNGNLKEYYSNGQPFVQLKQLTLDLKPKETKKDMQKEIQKKLKLKNVFNVFKLSDDVPLIVLGEYGKTPLIKLYNNISDNVSKKEFSKWLINEKAKKNEDNIFKKIKGLYFKIKRTKYINYGPILYTSLTLNENGIVTISIDFVKEENPNYVNLIQDTKKYIKTLLDKINKLIDIELIYDSEPIIKSITGISDLNKVVDTNHIQTVLLNKYLSNHLFEVKSRRCVSDLDEEEDEFEGEYEDEINKEETTEKSTGKTCKSKEISLYYKKYISYENPSSSRVRKPCNELVKLDTDKMGITVQIKDNLYGSGSIINVCSANNINEIFVIIDQIAYLNNLNENVAVVINKQIKDKSRIKYIRERLKTVGLNIEAKSCQPTTRHPSLDDKHEVDDNYVLNYKGLRIVCEDNDYKYPGFIGDKSVCCFKNDKRNDKNYKSNIDNIEENYIYPSNYVISITDDDNVTYNTLLLKMEDADNYTNYFFFNDKNELVHIKNSDIIDKIENDINIKTDNEQTIWMNKILLSDAAKPHSSCKYKPDFSNKSPTDLNKQCSSHETHIYFGYNDKGYPCCFDTPPSETVKIQEQPFDLKKMYIIKKEKFLFSGQLGVLLPVFENVFNKMSTSISDIPDGKFYRMGVYQNNSAFLNTISLGLLRREDCKTIKKEIVNHINDNPIVFDKLNNGDIRTKYKTIENYTNWINNSKSLMNVHDLIHILHIVYNINIIIFDIPIIYNKSEQKIDDNNIKLICNTNCKPINENKYLVIFKRNDKFDILVYNNNTSITYSFNYDDSEIFKMLNEFYHQTCIIKHIYPKEYTANNYDEFIDGEELIKVLDNTEYKIMGQIVDNDKKVKMLISKFNVMIPIRQNVIIDNLKIYDKPTPISGDDYMTHIQKINAILKDHNIQEVKINGITNNKLALVSNFGMFMIPILDKKTTNPLLDNVLPVNYYPMDSIVYKQELNKEQLYNNDNINIQNEIILMKKQFASVINGSKKLKKYVLSKQFKDRTNVYSQEYIEKSRFDLIKMYNEIFNKIIKVMKSKHNIDINNNSLYLSIISNEIIDDNVKNSLFNGNVTLNIVNTKEVKLQSNESLLTNYNDLYSYISSYFK
jgi:hypothetical protein